MVTNLVPKISQDWSFSVAAFWLMFAYAQARALSSLMEKFGALLPLVLLSWGGLSKTLAWLAAKDADWKVCSVISDKIFSRRYILFDWRFWCWSWSWSWLISYTSWGMLFWRTLDEVVEEEREKSWFPSDKRESMTEGLR